jgi:hypothetical protein
MKLGVSGTKSFVAMLLVGIAGCGDLAVNGTMHDAPSASGSATGEGTLPPALHDAAAGDARAVPSVDASDDVDASPAVDASPPPTFDAAPTPEPGDNGNGLGKGH